MRARYTAYLAAIGAILLAAPPAGAAPGDMSVATFLAKADALKAKGIGALFSADYKLLQAEGKAGAELYRTRLRAEKAKGTPSSCPPDKIKPSSDQILAHLRSYPGDKRPAVTMRTAMADYFIRNYPCRK